MPRSPLLDLLDEAQERVDVANANMREAVKMNFSEAGGRRLEAAIAEARSADVSLNHAVIAVVTALSLLEENLK